MTRWLKIIGATVAVTAVLGYAYFRWQIGLHEARERRIQEGADAVKSARRIAP